MVSLLDIDIVQLIISVFGSIYYAGYSIVYGLYTSITSVVNPLFDIVVSVFQIILDVFLSGVSVFGVLPQLPAYLLFTLCTIKIVTLMVRFVLRIIGSLPTVDGGIFRF